MIKKRRIKKLASTAGNDLTALDAALSPHRRRKLIGLLGQSQREDQKQKEKERNEIIARLEKSDPEKWIAYMEQQSDEEDKEFFRKIMKTLSLPSFTDCLLCLGGTTDLRTRRLYILGKTPRVTELAVAVLSHSPFAERLGKDRRHYIDVTGLDGEQKIRETLKSGLSSLALHFYYLAKKQHRRLFFFVHSAY